MAWGWLLLGILLGFLFRRAADALVTLAGGPALNRSSYSLEALLSKRLARTQDRHRRAVLPYLVQKGEQTLQEMSAASGHTPAALLAQLFAGEAAAGAPAEVASTGRSLKGRAASAISQSMGRGSGGEAITSHGQGSGWGCNPARPRYAPMAATSLRPGRGRLLPWNTSASATASARHQRQGWRPKQCWTPCMSSQPSPRHRALRASWWCSEPRASSAQVCG